MSTFTINPLLAYAQHNVAPHRLGGPFPCPILWDMRTSTDSAIDIIAYLPLALDDLAQPATQPPLDIMSITCGFFLGDWPITVHRPGGITVGDVLEAIYRTTRRRISHAEWNALSDREKNRIKTVFNSRWQAASDRDACRQNGVLRIDTLLQHTFFGGLSLSVVTDNSCILSLRRGR